MFILERYDTMTSEEQIKVRKEQVLSHFTNLQDKMTAEVAMNAMAQLFRDARKSAECVYPSTEDF